MMDKSPSNQPAVHAVTLQLFRRPDASIKCHLAEVGPAIDMDDGTEPHQRLIEIAGMLLLGANDLLKRSDALRPPDSAPPHQGGQQ